LRRLKFLPVPRYTYCATSSVAALDYLPDGDADVLVALARVRLCGLAPASVEQRAGGRHARCRRRILGAGDARQDLDAHLGVSMGLPPPVGCRRGIRVRVLRGDNQANSLAQNTLHRREEVVRSNDHSGHDLLLLFARGVIEALAIHASSKSRSPAKVARDPQRRSWGVNGRRPSNAQRALPKKAFRRFFRPPTNGRNRPEEHYLIVTCTVMTDEPEVVGPCPVALMANVSPPLYLVFALYS
jgi:hypothetical protein